MEAYYVKRDCPKCGETNNGSMSNLYISSQFVGVADMSRGQPSSATGSGFMRRRCGRCSYTWYEIPLDQTQA